MVRQNRKKKKNHQNVNIQSPPEVFTKDTIDGKDDGDLMSPTINGPRARHTRRIDQDARVRPLETHEPVCIRLICDPPKGLYKSNSGWGRCQSPNLLPPLCKTRLDESKTRVGKLGSALTRTPRGTIPVRTKSIPWFRTVCA